jgi:hypothetical protein
MRPYLKKTHHKKRMVEWLKAQALSSNPSTKKKKWERSLLQLRDQRISSHLLERLRWETGVNEVLLGESGRKYA